MARCFSLSVAAAMKSSSSSSSSMDLDNMKRSLDCMKANEIFELIERAINIAASQYPKELLQQRDRIVDMLLNSHINISDTHDEKRTINDGDDLWGDFPTIDEAESLLTEVASLDPLKLFNKIIALDDVIEDNDYKLLNQNEHEINTERKEDSISVCSTSSLTEDSSEICSNPQSNETNPKLKFSQLCKVTSSNSTKQNQNQQKDCLASLDDVSLQAKLENSKRKFIERQQQQQEKKRRKLLIEDNDDVEDNDHKSMNQNEQKIETQMQKDSICPCSSSVTENNSEKYSKPQKSQSCEVTSSNTTKQDQNQQKVYLASLDDASLQAKLENSKRKFIERQQQEEKKRRKIQIIKPLDLPKQEQQQIRKQSLFKPKRKLGVMIRC